MPEPGTDEPGQCGGWLPSPHIDNHPPRHERCVAYPPVPRHQHSSTRSGEPARQTRPPRSVSIAGRPSTLGIPLARPFRLLLRSPGYKMILPHQHQEVLGATSASPQDPSKKGAAGFAHHEGGGQPATHRRNWPGTPRPTQSGSSSSCPGVSLLGMRRNLRPILAELITLGRLAQPAAPGSTATDGRSLQRRWAPARRRGGRGRSR